MFTSGISFHFILENEIMPKSSNLWISLELTPALRHNSSLENVHRGLKASLQNKSSEMFRFIL